MEDNEWVHEGSRGCCDVNACISSYAAKWLFCRHSEVDASYNGSLLWWNDVLSLGTLYSNDCDD
jgi:hypothetical protein